MYKYRIFKRSSATAEKQHVSYACLSKIANRWCNSLSTVDVVRVAKFVLTLSSENASYMICIRHILSVRWGILIRLLRSLRDTANKESHCITFS